MATCRQCGQTFLGGSSEDAICLKCTQPQGPLRRVIVTPVLLGLIILLYVVMVFAGVSPFTPTISNLLAWGADFEPLSLGGQWWRMATAMFLHIGVVHLALNGWCLWRLGVVAERLLGSGQFALLYFVSGLGGSVLSLAVHPQIVSAGASGAIFGVAGALVALQYLRNLPLAAGFIQHNFKSIAPFVLYNLIDGLKSPGIDNSGHVGGLVTGLVLGVLLPLPSTTRAPTQRARTTAVVSGVLGLIGAGAAVVAHVQAPDAQFRIAAEVVDAGELARSLPLLKKAAASRPGFAPAVSLLGAVLLQMDSVDQSFGPLRTAVRLDSTNIEYRNELGAAFFKKGLADSAIVIFTQCVALRPNHPEGHFNLALALDLAGRHREAADAFRRAVALEPDSVRYRLLVGGELLAAQAFPEALAELDTVLARAPNTVEAYYRRGLAHHLMGDLEKARADFQRTKELRAMATGGQDFFEEASQQLEQIATEAGRRRRIDLNPIALRSGLESPPRVYHCPAIENPSWRKGSPAHGVVTAEFVVDSTGLVIESSIRVVYAADADLSAAVVTMLSQCSYVPGQKAGRPARVPVRQSWRIGNTP